MNGLMPSLAGLNEGLRVRQIAAFNLLTCSVGDELGAVLARTDLQGIDQIPIKDSERISSITSKTSCAAMRICTRSLTA